MKQVKIGVGFGLWRLGMPTPETIVHVAEKAEDWGLDGSGSRTICCRPRPN